MKTIIFYTARYFQGLGGALIEFKNKKIILTHYFSIYIYIYIYGQKNLIILLFNKRIYNMK